MEARKNALLIAALAALASAAGCSGQSPGFGEEGTGTDTDTDTDTDADGDSDSDGDGDSDTDSESACGEVEVEFEMETPTVMLLVDQSGSMTTAFGSSDRWETLRDSLLDAETGVIVQLEEVVRFSLQLYTSDGGFAGGDCPLLTGTDPALGAYDAIHDVFFANAPAGDTPTGESIDAAAAMLDADPHPDTKIIVLATDGEPDTCEVPNPQTEEAKAVSVAAAESAFDSGFKTYIISVGSDIGMDHLNDMAQAGQDDPAALPYQALDQEQLIAAFEDIIYGVRDCVLELNGEVQTGMVGECVVTVNEEELVYEEDWQLNSPSEIEILGEACEEIQHGLVTVDVWCPCEAYEGPE
ncbi:MAG: VWA domain-containing protein [Proteobacteria bacterium]|jgi:hypothetical protein|nr:VWA domain-containing protein [Pseudomonadota bacterium]